MDKHNELQRELLNRLKNIRGHITGIEKMVEEGKECEEIIIQLSAVKAAVEKAGLYLLENYTQTCLDFASIEDETAREKLLRLLKTVVTYVK